VLAVTIVAVAVAVVPAVAVLALGYLTHLPWFDGAFAWCRDALGLHHHVPTWLGVPAVAVMFAGTIRFVRVCQTWARFRCRHSDGVEIVATSELYAYTMPGPGGHIVVSAGLVDHLDDWEMAVVVAHERAHARHRHDLFVIVSAAAVALMPPLAPLRSRLRFALERWADESTVDELDVDRHQVARTLASVALLGAAVPAGAVGIVGLGVAGRVTALLEPPATSRSPLWMAVGVVGIVTVLAASAVQVHHVLPLLATLCPG
jgi:Zn-dependent protease with chaperone function